MVGASELKYLWYQTPIFAASCIQLLGTAVEHLALHDTIRSVHGTAHGVGSAVIRMEDEERRYRSVQARRNYRHISLGLLIGEQVPR